MRKVEAKRHSSNNLVRRQGLREIKQSFLIVCEGECTEPDYFNAFRLTGYRPGKEKRLQCGI